MHLAPKVGVRAVGFVEPVLPLHHHAQVLVVEHHYLDVQALHSCCGQLLGVHHEAAVPVHVNDNLHTFAGQSVSDDEAA